MASPSSTTTTTTPQKTHTCFFYGTLMAPSILDRVTSHTTHSPVQPLRPRPAILHNHRRHRVRDADYPAIVPCPSSSSSAVDEATVRGTCVSGLTDADVWRLDIFEGYEYVRKVVTVKIVQEQPLEMGKVGSEDETATATATTTTASVETGEEVEAETYIWQSPLHELEDKEWDYDEFVREKLWRWAGGQRQEYADIEAAVREQQGKDGRDETRDPTGGRSVNGAFEHMVDNGAEVKVGEMVRSAV